MQYFVELHWIILLFVPRLYFTLYYKLTLFYTLTIGMSDEFVRVPDKFNSSHGLESGPFELVIVGLWALCY